MSDEAREECGLFGVFGPSDAVEKTYYGLFAMQHRGEESAGIASIVNGTMRSHKGMGLVGDVFNRQVLDNLASNVAIGHVRYSTTGSSMLANAQPFVVNYSKGELAVAHNGNLVNAGSLRDEYEAHGSIFSTTMDTEIIAHLMAKPSHARKRDSLFHCLTHLRGAYSLLLLTPDELIAVRDPHGIRPLCLGKVKGGYAVASETCGFSLIDAEYVRDIEPGEAVFISERGLESEKFAHPSDIHPSYCIFEHIYFARPDSLIYGENVHRVRLKLGEHLAKEHPCEADVVVPVPDGGNSAAIGFSRESGIPLDFGFIRNHYIGRTFIQPSPTDRERKVEIKLNALREVVDGKRVVVIDDSLIRGTTLRRRVRDLRDVGAKEVHLRISCPPHKFPCYYGIDFPTKKELFASERSVEDVRNFLGADSLGYVSIEGLLDSVTNPHDHYCVACFSGEYPVDITEPVSKHLLEQTRDLFAY